MKTGAAAIKPLRAARLERVVAGANQEPGEDNSGPALYDRLQARLKEDAALRAYLHELVSSWGCPVYITAPPPVKQKINRPASV
jgi:hypothetical protein